MRNTITLNTDQQVLLKEYIDQIALDASTDSEGYYDGEYSDFIKEFSDLNADCEITVRLRGRKTEYREDDVNYSEDCVSASFEGRAEFYESGSDEFICALPLCGDIEIN